jgi:hypothetical protein
MEKGSVFVFKAATISETDRSQYDILLIILMLETANVMN